MESGRVGLAAGRAGPAEDRPAGVVERRFSRRLLHKPPARPLDRF
jgi:hypothetical protein